MLRHKTAPSGISQVTLYDLVYDDFYFKISFLGFSIFDKL